MTDVLTAKDLRGAVDRLRAAGQVDAGAEFFLEALRVRLAEAPCEAQLARGAVHLRSEQGYRALIAREWTSDSACSIEASATLFGLLAARDDGLAVDLGTGRAEGLTRDDSLQLPLPAVPHDPAGSVQQMLARETTHIVALPLRSGGALLGMASLELVWPMGIGLALPPGPYREDLETLAVVLAPHLLAMPLRDESAPDEARDPLLPVVGARTRPLLRVLSIFAQQDETLLLTGPTGTGKSRLAEWCHARSRRAAGPMATANLLAVPDTMQMAELFGWQKGAFTGATGDREGLVAAADGGTLFLDEIDKLTMAAQAGLLRLLETRRFTPLGSPREREVDVRFIVATNADLHEQVRAGLFREDLYYRVNVLPVRVDPLSERADEVPDWAEVMLQRRHAAAGGAGVVRFAPDALRELAAHRWPGNLRQLDNVVRRAYALAISDPDGSSESIGADVVRRALSLEAPDARGGVAADDHLRALAKQLVARAIALREQGEGLSLEVLDVLRGAVLRAAVEELGSVRDAYLLFGADALVQTRNHSAAYRRELGLLAELERTLDE